MQQPPHPKQPTHSSRQAIDKFVQGQHSVCRCATNELVELIRQQLQGAEERVEWGLAVFSRNGKDITGVGTENGEYCLYVPQNDVAEEFASSLGDVKRSGDRIKFEKLVDVRRAELKRMIAAQDHRRRQSASDRT